MVIIALERLLMTRSIVCADQQLYLYDISNEPETQFFPIRLDLIIIQKKKSKAVGIKIKFGTV